MDYINQLFAFAKKMLAREAVKYLIIGGTTFTLDLGGLVILHGILKVNLVVAASISYWTSIIFNFLANRHWTFQAKDKANLAKHAVLYSALLGINYLFTVLFILFATHTLKLPYTIAKVIAVAFQITWTYPIYKHVIFVSPKSET